MPSVLSWQELMRTLLGIFTFVALMVLPASALARIEQPLPPANSLGAPPVPCFPYGGSESICPENGYANPDPPEFLAATYYGTLEVQNHLVHIGEDITMSARTNNDGKPAWPTGEKGEPLQLGEVVSGCLGKPQPVPGRPKMQAPIRRARPPVAGKAAGRLLASASVVFSGARQVKTTST